MASGFALALSFLVSSPSSVGYDHGDALHVTDFVPSHPGLEVFMPNEGGKPPAYYLRDAARCEPFFEGPVDGNDTGRAVAADVSPDHPGAEVWAARDTSLLDAGHRQEARRRPQLDQLRDLVGR